MVNVRSDKEKGNEKRRQLLDDRGPHVFDLRCPIGVRKDLVDRLADSEARDTDGLEQPWIGAVDVDQGEVIKKASLDCGTRVREVERPGRCSEPPAGT